MYVNITWCWLLLVICISNTLARACIHQGKSRDVQGNAVHLLIVDVKRIQNSHAHARAHTDARTPTRAHTRTHTRTHTHTHTQTHAYACTRTHTHAHAQTHTHARTHARMHAHTNTHTHTHTLTLSLSHTHTHIHTRSSFCFRYVPSASEPIWFFSLTCRGNESSITECRSNGFNITNNYYYESFCRRSYGPFSVQCYHDEIGEGNFVSLWVRGAGIGCLSQVNDFVFKLK